MKNLLTAFTLLAFLSIPVQGAFAWTYEGLNSLNPFTGFRVCNTCQKVVKMDDCSCKCKKRKLTKCEKLHGIKRNDLPCGCAAPIQIEPMCPSCHRAF